MLCPRWKTKKNKKKRKRKRERKVTQMFHNQEGVKYSFHQTENHRNGTRKSIKLSRYSYGQVVSSTLGLAHQGTEIAHSSVTQLFLSTSKCLQPNKHPPIRILPRQQFVTTSPEATDTIVIRPNSQEKNKTSQVRYIMSITTHKTLKRRYKKTKVRQLDLNQLT